MLVKVLQESTGACAVPWRWSHSEPTTKQPRTESGGATKRLPTGIQHTTKVQPATLPIAANDGLLATMSDSDDHGEGRRRKKISVSTARKRKLSELGGAPSL